MRITGGASPSLGVPGSGRSGEAVLGTANPEDLARGAENGLERLRRCLESESLEAAALGRPAPDQVLEVDFDVQVRAQGAPQPELALDAGPEDLDLREPAQRRVAEQLAVQLEAAELLGHDRRQDLDPVAADAEPLEQVLERAPILLDFVGEAGEDLTVLGALVLSGRTARQLDGPDGAGQVVVEVDREVLRHASTTKATSSPTHQLQSSPGSFERRTGCLASAACLEAWRLGELSQHPTLPHF